MTEHSKHESKSEVSSPPNPPSGKLADAMRPDPSPVKTAVTPPPGYKKSWKPKTVAEHNAEVDALASEQYPT